MNIQYKIETMTTKLLSKISLFLLTIGALFSCVQEDGVDIPTPKNDDVVFMLRVPGNHNITRALDEAAEYEVKTLDILVFNNETGKYLSRTTYKGQPQKTGNVIKYIVGIAPAEGVTNYDFVLLANAREAITDCIEGSDGKIPDSYTKTTIQEKLLERITAGTGWINERTSSDYKDMPMWGELNNQTLENNKTYDQITLTRMTVKIDLSVGLEGKSANDKFEIEEVWLYNYNTKGYVIPKSGDEYWAGGKAVAPSTESSWLNTDSPINYTSNIAENSVLYSVYTFEAAQGTLADYQKNTCFVVKGSWTPEGKGARSSWYRLDFANTDATTLQSTYLPLLRNHHYNVIITMVNGEGYETKEDAYASKPGNLVTEIATWDEGGYVSGVWNGSYEIKFSSLEADFTQFGEPSPQVIKIRSNVPELKFTNFTDLTKGPTDGQWQESPTGTWTNGHFTVVVTQVGSSGDYKDYDVSITATPTVAGDPTRETRFKIKGSNLTVDAKITQDLHELYRLITTPDAMYPIPLDGAQQRVKVGVTSTHPYLIEFRNTGTMLEGVYDSEEGGNLLDMTNIPADRKEVYIQVGKHEEVSPRISSFEIKHVDTGSTASASIYNIVQVTPAIKATVEGGGYNLEFYKYGGTGNIKLESNVSRWNVYMELNGVPVDESQLSSFFDKVTGSGSTTIKFTANPLPDDVTEERIYTIIFKDGNSDLETTPPIKVTHKPIALGIGGEGTTPPWAGVRAEPGILSVNKHGELNLDGEGYIVYFKWGSTVAIGAGSGVNGNEFTLEDVAWVPQGYNRTINNWNDIQYPSANSFPQANNSSNGIGDPCKYAVKNNVVGMYKIPTAQGYALPSAGREEYNGITGGWYNKGLDNQQFYPYAGQRGSHLTELGNSGIFWTSTITDQSNNGFYPRAIVINNNSYDNYSFKHFAYPIRCVRQ